MQHMLRRRTARYTEEYDEASIPQQYLPASRAHPPHTHAAISVRKTFISIQIAFDPSIPRQHIASLLKNLRAS